MNKNNLLRHLSCLLVLCLPFFAFAQNADLELTMTSNNPSVGIYEYVIVTVSVQNEGTQVADNVEIAFNLPAGAAIAGEFPTTVSQGSINGFYGGSTIGLWTVGSIAPETNEMLTLTFFTLAETNIFYGQVSQSTTPDSDSTPGNGTCCTANEDDEAAYTFPNEGGDCSFDQAYAELNCNNNNTPNDATDDTYELSFRADGADVNGNVGIYNVDIPALNYINSLEYTAGFVTIPNIDLSVGEVELTFRAAADNADCEQVIVLTPPTCGQVVSDCGAGNTCVDLELTTANTPTPGAGAFENANAQFTLQNNIAGENATGIQITFNKSQLNVVGSPTVSQGSISLYWTDNPVWNVGDLAANETATISFDLYTLAADYGLYGEVTSQDQSDADSTPANGNGATSAEDDEALYGAGGQTSSCNLTILNTEITCADDTFNSDFVFEIEVSGATGNTVDYEIPGTDFGGTIAVGQLVDVATLPQGLDFTVVVTDSQSEDCEYHLTSNIPIAPGVCGNGGVNEEGPDVSLDVPANSNMPIGIYEGGESVFTLTNTGTEAATGLIVTFSKNQVNITGTPIVTAGTTQLHWTDNPIWQVGTLAPGQTETIIFPVFTVGETVGLYGEVTAMNENDIDSTPDNGNGATPIEDDEALWPTGDTNVDLVDFAPIDGLVNLSGTAPGSTINYILTYENIGTAASAGSYVVSGIFTDSDIDGSYLLQGSQLVTSTLNPNETTTISGEFTLGNNVSDGLYYFGLIIDAGGNEPESNEENNQILFGPYLFENGGLCNIDIALIDVACSETEGFYDFTIDLTSQNPGPPSQLYTILNGEFLGVETGTNGIYTFSNIPLSQGQSTLNIYDSSDADCGDVITIDAPLDCGLIISDGVDLSLDVNVPQNTASQYDTFSATFSLTNEGNQPSAGSIVSIETPAGLVFQGSNVSQVSQGSFSSFSGNWNVGELPVGATATLTVNYFTLTLGEKILYGQVSSSDADTDSNASNGTCCTPNEDDETAGSILISANFAGQGIVAASAINAYPNPVDDLLQVEIFSEVTQSADLQVIDVNNRSLTSQELSIIKGKNTADVSVNNLLPGVYFLTVRLGEELVTRRFLKM